jgi:O-antigen ligase
MPVEALEYLEKFDGNLNASGGGMKAIVSDRHQSFSRLGPSNSGTLPGFLSTARSVEVLEPNALVRWAFYLSIFAIPFQRLYLPGTGDRVGVTRCIQMLLLLAVASQPRVCLRFVPAALFWFLGYAGLRVVSGLFLTPGLRHFWWPSTFELVQFSLPWIWIIFNVVQFPRQRRAGLWALVWGASLCALLHVLGIGVSAVDDGAEGRSTIFLTNANVIGANYAVAMIIVASLGLFSNVTPSRRLFSLASLALIGTGLAKTGSRTAALLVVMGVLMLLFQSEALSSKGRRLISLLLIVVVLIAVAWQVPTVRHRFEKISPSNLQQIEGRVRMIPVLWEIFLRSPVYGSGPDHYQVELTRRAMPHLIREQRTISAHNLVLLLLAETGVIGFLVFATGLWKALVSAWRVRTTPEGFLPLALLVPYVTCAIIFANPLGHATFWLVIAYGLAGSAVLTGRMENSLSR